MRYLIAFVLPLLCFVSYAQRKITPTDEFNITGIVKRELTLNLKSLANFKQDSIPDVVVRNKHSEQKVTVRGMKGILLKTILDSAKILARPRDFGEIYIVLTASDGYKNIYSWNELFNNEAGNQVYLITEAEGKTLDEMTERIVVISLSDIALGSRNIKGLAKIEVKKLE